MILYRNKKGVEETLFDGSAEDFFNYIGQYFAEHIVPNYKGPWPPTDASVKEYGEQNPSYWKVIADHKQQLRDFVKARHLKFEKEWERSKNAEKERTTNRHN